MLQGGTVPVYLVPTVGGGVWYQRVTVDQTLLSVDGPGDGPNCAVAADQLRTTRSTWRGRPTASMGLQIGFGEASYQFQLDTERLSDSVHAFTLGAQW